MPKTPKKEDDMEVEYEKVPTDDDTSGSQSAEVNLELVSERNIFDRDDLYESDDSDQDSSDDELADQFRMGHHMDTLLSDDYIPDECIGRQCADALQKQLIEFWTGMDRSYLATGKSIYRLPARIYRKLQAVQRKSYKLLVPENVTVFT